MPSLIGTTVSANYLKTAPGSIFGTRSLRYLDVKLSGGGIGLVDLRYQKAASSNGTDYDTVTGTYADTNSWFSAAVRAVQTGAEIYAVGVPDADEFVVVVADDTSNVSDTSTNDPTSGTYGDIEAAVKAAIEGAIGGGTVASPTYPTVTVTITSAANFVGGTITFA